MIASGSSSSSRLLLPVNVLFAATFFLGRVVVYGLCLAIVLWQDKNVFADNSMWQLAPICTIAGYMLNCFWFRKIVEECKTASRCMLATNSPEDKRLLKLE